MEPLQEQITTTKQQRLPESCCYLQAVKDTNNGIKALRGVNKVIKILKSNNKRIKALKDMNRRIEAVKQINIKITAKIMLVQWDKYL